ncbi:hypothetical protein [Hymenobacter lapidiphilus]|uniref:hypothetical protein n=1 Tax=Hymenobacter lapidiphilus TaxID=2608003 RepID=UPI001FEC880B|nr:hypothetical protein [Hymenobacter lapidiphilus]
MKAAGALAFVAHTLAGFVASFERRGLHQPPTPTAHNAPAPPTTEDPQATYSRAAAQ